MKQIRTYQNPQNCKFKKDLKLKMYVQNLRTTFVSFSNFDQNMHSHERKLSLI